jgi:hypothetical protein
MSYLATARKIKQELQQAVKHPDGAPTGVLDGPIIAVLIDSPEVGPIWLSPAMKSRYFL